MDDDEYQGGYIPKGTTVLANIWYVPEFCVFRGKVLTLCVGKSSMMTPYTPNLTSSTRTATSQLQETRKANPIRLAPRSDLEDGELAISTRTSPPP